ncbi:MAG: EMC3/TMCO1 family protein [Candidatus Pacearchaeota archaeon]|nr:EMC3/TMCO1 family protein [Candidatus Pacearchaeota archaeon]
MALKEFIIANPKISIIVISGLISLFISLVNYFVMDKEKVMKGKERQKELQKEIKANKDNPSKIMELQKEMMSHVGENFKHSLKPMMITMLPILVVFWWIKDIFAESFSGWFWWYLISAIVFSIIFRKIFKLP